MVEKYRNINLRAGDNIKIKYNNYELIISTGARNSLYIEGVQRIGFDDKRATYLDVPNRIKIHLRE